MTVGSSKVAALSCVLLLACISVAAAQDQGAASSPKIIGYRSGQVWTTGVGALVTVLAVENFRKIGRLVHVRIDGIPWQDCGDIHLTRAIEHLAVTEKMMRKSDLSLLKENVALPASYLEPYRTWEAQNKHEVVKVPIPKAIFQTTVPGPMICNLLPRRT
jgi:hypothetical protein